ncbi:hypothetical protein IL992_05205 [Microbispora sp. NEAU-D428]|uniref:hypothetical protein n=1 Tax=Microbispora sitophila TaxID=2771537 RepID=UPI001865A8FC|nr:hypothetical protein [Microbispora sitophila]MBE3008585.1 hypothetical protein [Microbispora sitophila]
MPMQLDGRLFDLSPDVASDRTAGRVAVVLERLEPYRDVPKIRELLVCAAFPGPRHPQK